MDPLTFVTPVFEAETELLGLQARSFARHADDALVHEVVVLDNTRRGLPDPGGLRSAYGPLAGRVRVLRPDDVCHVPAAPGWRTQQVLKLAVAAHVTSPRYVCLDAKNHLVAAPTQEFFEAPDGRPRVRGYGYREHPLRPSLERVLLYLGLDPAEHLDRFAATVTPFVLVTQDVLAMTSDVQVRAGRPFAHEFVAQDLTEFFLLAGWLARRDGGVEHAYDLTDLPNAMVWPRAADPAGVAAAITAAREHDLPVFGVHREAVGRLDDTSIGLLADFWAEREVLPDVAAGTALLSRMRAGHARAARLRRWHDLPGRARTAVRRASRAVRR